MPYCSTDENRDIDIFFFFIAAAVIAVEVMLQPTATPKLIPVQVRKNTLLVMFWLISAKSPISDLATLSKIYLFLTVCEWWKDLHAWCEPECMTYLQSKPILASMGIGIATPMSMSPSSSYVLITCFHES